MNPLRLILLTLLVAVPAVAQSSRETAKLNLVSEATRSVSTGPNLGELTLVTRLPRELPQQVTGFAFDGEKLWAALYVGKGRYATLDPSTLTWKKSESEEHHKAIREVAGAIQSPGGICFINGRLWVGGANGESFGSIDLATWKIDRLFKGKQRNVRASQSYASFACDGNSVWIAWHWFNYKLPDSEVQLLLQVNPETGKVIKELPLPIGRRNDGTHGLTWDGNVLWHMKGSNLSAIDPATGAEVVRYVLDPIKRASGLAWDGKALWIIEFDGAVWHLPF